MYSKYFALRASIVMEPTNCFWTVVVKFAIPLVVVVAGSDAILCASSVLGNDELTEVKMNYSSNKCYDN